MSEALTATRWSRPRRQNHGCCRGHWSGSGLSVSPGFRDTEIFFGARSAERLYFLEESKQVSELHIATDDGSRGHHGVITELLERG